MGRWITFDQESTTAIAAATSFRPELHDAGRGADEGALRIALASGRDAVLLTPAADSEHVIVAHIRHVPVAPAMLGESGTQAEPAARADLGPDVEILPAPTENPLSRTSTPPAPKREQPKTAPQAESNSRSRGERVYEAGGFLGLRDVPVYDDEPAPPKKWWQKLLD